MNSYLFIIFDSLRYDTFEEAHAPFIKDLGDWEKAYSHGTYTGPACLSILCGQLPTSFCNKEYYDIIQYAGDGEIKDIYRDKDKLWISKGMERTRGAKNYFYGQNIIDWANEKGYMTLGTGAVGWWNQNREPSNVLISEFRRYGYFGNIDQAERQVAWVIDEWDQLVDIPHFTVINFGETHVPYYYEGCPWERTHPWGDIEESRYRQKACLEYLDVKIEELFTHVDLSNTNIIMCADHGDCMGDGPDKLWGHGFYHPKVMEVPLMIRLVE